MIVQRTNLPPCVCGIPGAAICVDCRRVLCVWHCAGRPFQLGAKVIAVEAVCLPACKADFWKDPKKEGIEWKPV